MKILAIETSCDETGLTILNAQNKANVFSFKVLANALASQIKIHQPYGGVFPMLAKREHIRNLPILYKRVLEKAKIKENKIDVIAVTSGPGLEPALWTGIVFAKELAEKLKVPLVPTNHMEGHIFSVFAKNKGEFTIPKIQFPALSLLISGGHTELVLMKDFLKYQIVGQTLDDAVGEAFDKAARMMDLPYPGGIVISRLAKEQRKLLRFRSIAQAGEPSVAIREHANMRADKTQNLSDIKLPRPMMYSKNLDFSFSGLKTATLYLIRKLGILDEDLKRQISLEFEEAVTETLVHKTKKATEKYRVKTLIVGGGVSANKYIKKRMEKTLDKKINILFPGKGLSTDNSIMIGIAGYLQYIKKPTKFTYKTKIKANGNLKL